MRCRSLNWPLAALFVIGFVCSAAIIACQGDDDSGDGAPQEAPDSNVKQAGEHLRSMNQAIDEALNLAEQVQDDLDNGRPADANKLKRIRELIEPLAARKHELLRSLPVVAGVSFDIVYRQLKFLDDLIELAKNLAGQLAASDDPGRTKEFLKRVLTILKAEKQYLEGFWPDMTSDGFHSMNQLLDGLLTRLESEQGIGEGLSDVFDQLEFFKEIGAGEIPAQVFGRDMAWWYGRLAAFDGLVDMIEAVTVLVQLDFSQKSVDSLFWVLNTMKEVKQTMEGQLPD